MSPAFLSFWEKICSQGFSSVDTFLRMSEQNYSHCFICVLPSLPLPPISRNLWFIVHFFPVPIAVLLPKPEFEMWNLEKEWLHRIQRCIVTLTIKSRCTSGGRVSPVANIDMGFKAWFIYFFLPFVVLSVLSERHLNDWLVLGKHLEFCFFLVFFLDIVQIGRIAMLFFFFCPQIVYVSLSSPQKEPKTTLPRSWRKGMMINRFRMPELAILRESSKEHRV